MIVRDSITHDPSRWRDDVVPRTPYVYDSSRTPGHIFMEFDMDVMLLEAALKWYFLIYYNRYYQRDGSGL
jgi:hypothetical protein